MLKSFHVAPLGQNYTEFLESNDDTSLASFLQERLEKYKECVLQLSQQHPDLLKTKGSSGQRGGIDALVDGLIAVYDDTRAVMTAENWGALPAFWERFERIVSQLKLLRINKDDFETIKALTRGQYGKVTIVRSRLDGNIYAMKTLNKMYILSQKDKILYMEERQVLAITSEWFPKLHVAFQDEVNLYLVMEYAPGGDLYSILDKKQDELNKNLDADGDQGDDDGNASDDEDTTLTEDEIRFYIAEIVLAVSELHKNHYIHRDLKPQNILLDATGHIMLADFGACAKLDASGQVHGQTVPLGTWDYMSPEVVDAQSGGKPYGKEVDWWAVGVVMFELLVGEPPYFAESAMGIIRLLRDHEKNLSFEKVPDISQDCRDLITRLLARKENRLGKNGVEEIKAHPFFNGIDWDNIRKTTPPFLPIIETPDDTSNFRFDDDLDGSDETMQDKQSTVVDYRGALLRRFEGYNLAFIGYTYQTFVDFAGIPVVSESQFGQMSSSLQVPNTKDLNKFRREPSLTGLDKEDVGRMRMEQEMFRLTNELATKEDLLSEFNAVHQALLTQYEDQVARATATESELSAKLVGIAAVAGREREEAEEMTSDLKNSLESLQKKTQALEHENEAMRAKCADLENEIERQRESILKQEIEGGKVSLLKAENEELKTQKEKDKLQENQLLLAEMERGNRIREENEALRLQIRDQERQDEQKDRDHKNAISELKKTLRGVQEDVADQLQTRKKLEEELRQINESRATLQSSLSKIQEKLEQRDIEVAQLTKACEAAVAAIDSSSSSGPNGNGSVRTIYPSMLRRERASNKVLVQQLEEQGEKITELESKIKQLEQDKSRQLALRSPERVASPVHSLWSHDSQSIASPTKMLMDLVSPDDFSGWIRISWPSAEKRSVKQSWKKQFIVLRDLKIFALDKEGDPATSSSTKLLADLRSDFFCVRTVNRSELIHATAKELECIFQTTTGETYSSLSTPTSAYPTTPTTGMNRSEIQAKIDNLKAEIQKEEQIKRGAESMQAAWMGSKGNSDTYLKSKENVDACIKNIREKTAEVEKLSAALLIAPEFALPAPKTDKIERSESSQELFSTERSLKIKELEKLITVERRHLEAAEKMAAPLMNSASNVVRRNWKSAVEVQMDSSKQRLANLQAELDKLNSGAKSTSPIQGGHGTWMQQKEIYGHMFQLKHYTIPKSCHQCHDVLWGSQKSGYECSGKSLCILWTDDRCKYVAHKQCLDLLTISCQEQQGLRHSLPIYLLAHDKHEQKRWIRTIELHRKRAEAAVNNSNGNSNGHGYSSTDSHVIESPSSSEISTGAAGSRVDSESFALPEEESPRAK
ncbi:Serine/threonine-protein kinase MRCK alpha [Gryganskiella cystojenkinii]|nr:Serine/threonine-protein kinase MRCK alpha [Gryganskiella cystojenkinii]